MSDTIPQSVLNGCRKYVKSRIIINTFNTFNNVTEKDKKLIEEANSTHDYFKIWKLEEQADTDEARQKMHNRASTLYHHDEYYSGIL